MSIYLYEVTRKIYRLYINSDRTICMCLFTILCRRHYPTIYLVIAFGGLAAPNALGKADYSLAKNTVIEAIYIQSGYKEKVKQIEVASRKQFGNQKVVATAVYAGSLIVKKEIKVKTGPWRFDAAKDKAQLTFTIGF